MSTNSLQSLHHHHHHHRSFLRHHHHHSDAGPSSSSSSLKPTTNPNPLSLSLSTTTTTNTTNTLTPFSLSPSTSPSSLTSTTTTTISTSPPVSFNLLQQHLQSQNFRLADEETRRLLISLAGEAAEKRGYVFFSEVQFISEADLKAIDALWRQYSDDKFGYSVQKRIWEKGNKDFTNFFVRVGWMKKLESSEVEQYNYRAFPDEFVWENGKETPVGHLPLTNALRGTQLLCCILSHPAFDCMQDEEEEEGEEVIKVANEDKGSDGGGDNGVLKTNNKPLSKRVFKTDYSF